jgi:glycosyltransferase involved in cell wall biosynthesis
MALLSVDIALMHSPAQPMIIISNGFFKCHLSIAAAEAYKRGTLSSFLTGAYPTPTVRKVLALPILRANAKAMQLKARKDEIPDELVHVFFSSEALSIFAAKRRSETAAVDAYRHYGRLAVSYVERAAAAGARIYHYRAAFGGQSVDVAKKHGMITLCDHSIAHPSVIETLIENMGKMPAGAPQRELAPLNAYLLHDIEQADAVLVNSDFVKSTFEDAGHSRSPVHVVYLGVDDAFLDRVPARGVRQGSPRLLFAGAFQKRKGAEALIEALGRLGDSQWQLEIAGSIAPEIKTRYKNFLADPRVILHGHLSRPQLASAMSSNDIFVFPSLAEGSARVVFEAMACGCYIITTSNTGSVVEDGVHGRLVPAGDAEKLADAIEDASSTPAMVAEAGRRNAQLVRESYRQSQYGDKLAALYCELLTTRNAAV